MATVDSEIDTCRICSAPAEEDQPLFYPCKCSGTIRYIHQDCLTTWLAHSKKRSCDVCKYEYGFTKVYKSDMPQRLPPKLFFRKLFVQFAQVVIISLRLVMISIIWLAMLPYLTLLVWRLYFWTGEALAYWIVGREPLSKNPPILPLQPNDTDVPQQTDINATSSLLPSQEHKWIDMLPQDLGADVFKGQIITIAVVIVFLTIFLLREWIIQNARPGVFGDEDIPEGAAAAPEAGADDAQVPDAQVAAVDDHVLPALEEIPPTGIPFAPVAVLDEGDDDVEDGATSDLEYNENSPLLPGPYTENEWEDDDSDMSFESDPAQVDEDAKSVSSQGKGKEREIGESNVSVPSQEGSEHTMVQTLQRYIEPIPSPMVNTVFTSSTQEPPVLERDLLNVAASQVSSKLGNDLSLPSSFAFSSPLAASQPLTQSIESSLDGTRSASSQISSSSSSAATESQFQSSTANFPFTFSPPTTTATLDSPDKGSVDESKALLTFFDNSGVTASVSPLVSNPPAPNPLPFPLIPAAGLPPPSDQNSTRRIIRLPRSGAPPKHMSASTPMFDRSATEFDEFRFSFASTPTTLSQSSSRHSSRPPLPPSTPGVDEPLPSTAGSGTSSPGLALYRPPEDIASAVRNGGYFDRASRATSSAQELELRLKAEMEREAPDEPTESGTVIGEPAYNEPTIIQAADAEAAQVQALAQQADELHPLFQIEPEGDIPPPDAPAREIVEDDNERDEDDMQDADPIGDDDMDGALEAIGMRGPITSVFQNVFLMIFIIDLAIAAGIWMPFTIGKITALLFLQPEDVFTVVRFPIILVRILTDPIVDALLFLLNMSARPLQWIMASILPAAIPVAKKAATVPVTPKPSLNFTIIQDTILHHWDRLIAHSQAAANASAPRPFPTNAVERIVFRLPAPTVRSLEDIESRFAALGRAVRLFSYAFARRWQQLAITDGTQERAFAIALGYLVLTMAMGIYLGVLNAGAVRGAARALRNAVKQQLIVVKVALFIGLELLVFPTGCGVVLDIATLPLFESATLAGRIAFYDFAPLTAFFCHWLVGTIFMYQFALTLGACRAVMRPGAMWFIKDPQDASFSPIRDILDKHVLTQLRKLAVSAVMYTVVIVVAVGSVAYTLRFAPVFSGVLPLRGNMREPLSEIPVDLLFLHLVVPPTVKRLTISVWVRARLEEWWKYTARQLRLSSFMFGKLYADELQSGSSMLRPVDAAGEGWTLPNYEQMYGRWLRVPKGDNIAFLRDAPVLIEVNQDGRAVRERGQEVMEEQDQETRRAGRQPDQDYTIVHVPPMFGARCILLITLLWITAATVVVTGTAGPIIFGRWLVARTTGKMYVHDGYSLVVGWYVLWGIWRLERAMRAGTITLWNGLAWMAQVAWLGLGLGVITPTLLALAVEVYIILPLRVWWNPELVPVIRVVEDWALGLVFMKIGWQTWRLRMRARNAVGAAAAANPEPNVNAIVRGPEGGEEDEGDNDQRMEDLGRAMENIMRNGLTRPDALAATREFIVPVCGGLLLVIGAPAMMLWGLERVLPGQQRWGSDALLTIVYPGIFCGTAMVGVWKAGSRAGRKWLQGVRDEEFLVELRLRNLEPSAGRRL